VTGESPLGAAVPHTYAVTLKAALADQGVYAGSILIGGGIERSDAYRMMASQPERSGDAVSRTLNPDDIAEEAWRMFSEGDRA
jgi:hypothetical protein